MSLEQALCAAYYDDDPVTVDLVPVRVERVLNTHNGRRDWRRVARVAREQILGAQTVKSSHMLQAAVECYGPQDGDRLRYPSRELAGMARAQDEAQAELDALLADREILRELGRAREARNVARAAYCDAKNTGESINLGEAARNANEAYYNARQKAGARARELAGL